MSAVIEPGFESSALNGYFMANMPLKDVIAELIDNAFDANADMVRVNIDKHGISVMDDGEGIADMTSMFRVGKSGRHSSVKSIGQFGVGAKNALLSVGSITDICTRFEGSIYEARADWMHMAESGFSPIAQKITTDRTELRNGNAQAMAWWVTRVSVRRPHPQKGRLVKNAPALAKSIAIRYRPAIMHGKSIVLSMNRTVYDLRQHETHLTGVSDQVSKELSINGKALTINAGIAIEQVPGLTGCALVSYGHRLIETPSNIHGHILDRKLFLAVDLSTDWRRCLTTHKNRVTTDRELLMEYVWKAISKTVETLDEQKKEIRMEITLDGLGKDVGSILQRLNEIGTEDIGEGGEDETRDPGPGTGGGGGGGGGGPTKPAKVIPGEKRVPRKPKQSPRNVQFSIVCDPKLLGLTDVRCSVGPVIAEIIVFINNKQDLISEMFESRSRTLQLLIASSLSQYFLTSKGKEDGDKLFGSWLTDADMTESLQYGVLSGEIMKRLSPPKIVTDKELDF